MKILLIAGHGAGDPGACAFSKRECDMTRELVELVKNALSKYECETAIYPMARSAYHDLIAEGYAYNFKPYDYVLEVHFNAYQNDAGNGKVKGSEVYVTSSESIVSVEQKMLASLASLGFTNRGVKRKNFSVISEAKRQGVSSALLETCFIDDLDDMAIYNNKRAEIADAIADAIASGYKLQRRSESMASFKDISGHWAEGAIEALYSKGLINGYADGTFKPDMPITRAEICALLVKLIQK